MTSKRKVRKQINDTKDDASIAIMRAKTAETLFDERRGNNRHSMARCQYLTAGHCPHLLHCHESTMWPAPQLATSYLAHGQSPAPTHEDLSNGANSIYGPPSSCAASPGLPNTIDATSVVLVAAHWHSCCSSLAFLLAMGMIQKDTAWPSVSFKKTCNSFATVKADIGGMIQKDTPTPSVSFKKASSSFATVNLG